ncbi:MAG: hydantoinase/oxoprolinase family protein [Usitatibacter sp.]
MHEPLGAGAAQPRVRIAVDIGGTFTDGVAEWSDSGEIRVAKSLTTPDDPGRAVRTVIAELVANAPGAASQVTEIVHATTLVTNAIISRRGARTALVVTRGTRDVPRIRRELRYHLYDLSLELPEPLVAAEHCFELTERTAIDGQVVEAPREEELQAISEAIRAAGIQSVAICLLHAYVNPSNEEAVAASLGRLLASLPITVSSAIVREAREYERMSTTAANAYTRPLMQRYLMQLRDGIHALHIDAPIRIMVSNGGFTSTEAAAAMPIALLESGPAAGVISAGNAAAQAGMSSRVLAFDMGGTTAKACVIVDRKPRVTHSFETARVRRFRRGSGLPMLVTSMDLIEIGAGGGSIADIGALDTLVVGPRSAEGEPGPACYGHGGTEFTVTDADLMLGYIDPDAFLGGRMKLEVEPARQAAARLGERVGMDALQIAAGVREVVDENMASAARVHIAERGYDPRDFVLVATGGAGPVHAVGVARKLGVSRVLCPIAAGAGSCLGLLAAPAQSVRSWTHRTLLRDADWKQIQLALRRLHEEAVQELQSAGASGAAWRFELEMRYLGQGHQLNVQIEKRTDLGPEDEVAIAAAFEGEYRRVFGTVLAARPPIEVLNWRIFGAAESGTRSFSWPESAAASADEAALRPRRIHLAHTGAWQEVPVYNRYRLPPGTVLEGPVVLQEAESTLVVPLPSRVEVLPTRSVLVTLAEAV